jgi:hypothetical protein
MAPAAEAKAGSGSSVVKRLAVVLVVVFVVAGGALANASLSSRYSPQQATLDYFVAASRGDPDGMIANATFLRGDSSVKDFFGRAAVAAMLRRPENQDIRNVKIVGTRSIDSSTSKVTLAMTWAGTNRTATYTVRKDTKQVNYLFYSSWRVDIPYSTISVTLPNQPGVLQVDGIYVPFDSSSTSIKVIAGYHELTMVKTSFYDTETTEANGVDADPSVSFAGKISSDAMTAAAAAINRSFKTCDASKSQTCPNHTYSSGGDPNYIYYWTLPGYPEIDYNTYVFTINSDPTAAMKLVVAPESNKLTASGTCAETLTADGSRNYSFTGTWSANLTWSAASFVAGVSYNCLQTKA